MGPSADTTTTDADDGGIHENINKKDNSNESSTGREMTKTMRSRATSWVLEQVRKSYRERLDTFANPTTYFAKPVDISPLVCARFGWSNTAPNVLTCSNNDNNNNHTNTNGEKCCNAVLYVKFHPNLSPHSRSTLTQTYRRLLAESHSKSCPFRADAERWLLIDGDDDANEPNNDATNTTNNTLQKHPCNDRTSSFVPPYLFSMSRAFEVLEDCSANGFITREFVRREATTLGIAMTIVEMDGSRGRGLGRKGIWRTVVPKEVLDRFDDDYGLGRVSGGDNGDEEKDCVDVGDSHMTALQNAMQTKLMACLAILPGVDNDSSQHPQDNEGKHTTTTSTTTAETRQNKSYNNSHRYIRNESALLAVFGWRFDPWPSPQTSSTTGVSKVLRVKCPLCLASEEIPRCVTAPTTTSNSNDGDTLVDKDINNTSTAITTQQPPFKKRRKIPPPNDVLEDVDHHLLSEESSVSPSNQAQSRGKGVQTDSATSAATDRASANSFDVLNSHRHFCPYVSGFASHRQRGLVGGVKGGVERGATNELRNNLDCSGTTSIAATPPAVAVVGWERVIDALMRPRGVMDEGNGQDSATVKKRSISREETFQFLRRALQS